MDTPLCEPPLTALLQHGATQKSVNEAEEFSFASGEKEAIIVELKEEARILRARMENNPEIKRHAGSWPPCPSSPLC
jgi:hypothetical protein